MNTVIKLSLGLLFCLPTIAIAAGIQVSPAKLDFAAAIGKSVTQNITVVNPTADVQVFEVYSDDFADAIKPMPASFTLESGGKKTVSITVDALKINSEKTGKLGTNLSVVAKPLADNKFSVGTGVKIPLTITINTAPEVKNNSRLMLFSLGLFLLVCLGIYFKMIKTQKLV